MLILEPQITLYITIHLLIIHDRALSKLDMETEPTNARKCIKVSCIINIVSFLHVSAVLMAILRELHYKGWIYRDITNVCAKHRCKIRSFNNERFKIHIKI